MCFEIKRFKKDNINTTKPLVSVIMSVYNSSKYLAAAINSILKQDYKKFEFIIINDASNDESEYLIKSFNDSRIIYIKNKNNIGLASSLNIGISIAKGKYIIRMDADDESIKNRIGIQVKYMEKNLKIGVAGSYFKLIGNIKTYKKLIIRKAKIKDKEINSQMIFAPCVLHPSVIIRKEILIKNNIYYNESFRYAQDYDLWARLIKVTKITNIPKVLFKWRISNQQASNVNRKSQINISKVIQIKILKDLLGYNPSEEQLRIHSYTISQEKLNVVELRKLDNWLIYILEKSKYSKTYNYMALKNECSFHWLNNCLYSLEGTKWIKIYFKSKLGLIRTLKFKHYIIAIKKAMIFIKNK